MKATHILYEACGKPDFSDKGYPIDNIEEDEDYKCGLCGDQISNGVATKNIFKANFNDYNYFDPTCPYLCPSCPYLCPSCAYPFTDQAFRRTSFICTPSEFIPLKRPDLEYWLFNPPKGKPFVFCITTSFKKHLVFKAQANKNPNKFYIQFDDIGLMFEPERYKYLFDIMTEMYDIFSKSEMRTGNYYQSRVKRFGISQTFRFENFLRPARGSAVFTLLLHALNKQEEEDKSKNADE